ncbi:MAG TPA: thiamine diphosphokinase [Coriobacteriia bacterium]|nr:thiamine diphosphokinase [Coriobacteriia bacterium]
MTGGSALLVGAAPAAGTAGIVASLAPGCDVVIAIDGGAAACMDADIVPDVTIGDFDSLAAAVLEKVAAAGSTLIPFSTDKDVSDLDLALTHAAGRGVDRVVVTGVLAARVDHTLASAGSLCRSEIPNITVQEPELTAWVMRQGARDHLVLTGEGATLSIMAVLGEAIVSLSGVRWPLDKFALAPASSLGLSNVISNDRAVIRVHQGAVLAMSPRLSSAKPAAQESRHTP